MILEISKKIVSNFEKEGIIEDEREIYEYGIAMNLSYMIGSSVILLISFATSNVWNSIIYLFLFDKLRSYTGGFHASTYVRCNALFISMYVIHLFAKEVFSLYLLMGVSFLCLLFLLPYIPVEHPNKPIDVEERATHQKKSIFRFILSYFVSFLLLSYGDLSSTIYLTIIFISLLGFLQLHLNKGGRNNV